MWLIKRKLSWLLKHWAWILEGRPKSKAVPLYRNNKLVAYDEFLLNQIGEVYIELKDNKFGNIKRRIFLFDTMVLDEVDSNSNKGE